MYATLLGRMRESFGMRCVAWFCLALFCCVGAGCAHGFHKAEDQQVTAFASYGDPRTDDPLWWIGEGDAKNVGLTFGYNYFLADDLAFLAEFTPLRRYSQDGETIHAIEFQLGVRGFFWSADLSGPSKIGLFFDVAAGFMAANARVPDRGTKSNLTADFGPGIEYRINEEWSILGGYRLHHISNIGPTETSNNPGQNDDRYYLGVGYSW